MLPFVDKYVGCRFLRLLPESVGFNELYLFLCCDEVLGVSSFGLFPGFDNPDRLSYCERVHVLITRCLGLLRLCEPVGPSSYRLASRVFFSIWRLYSCMK